MKRRIKNYFTGNTWALEAVSILLCAMVLVTTYSIFDLPIIKNIAFGLVCLAIIIPNYMFCHFINKHHKLGTVLCIIIYGLVMVGLSSLSYVGMMQTDQVFMQWLVRDNEELGIVRSYEMVLIIGGGIFFSTCTFYYSMIKYRLGMITVVSLLPCVLYAKAIADVNNWYLVILAGLNIILKILRRRYENSSSLEKGAANTGSTADAKRSILTPIVLIAFTAVILLISAVIPKQSKAKYYAKFEDTFLGGDTKSEVKGIADDLTQMSGNAEGFNPAGNRRLYAVYGNDVSYLKRQNFDVYDYAKDTWTAIPGWNDYGITMDTWEEVNAVFDFESIRYALETAEELSPGFAAKYGMTEILAADPVNSNTQEMTVVSLNFGANYYIAPIGAITILPDDEDKPAATFAGSFIRTIGKHDDNFRYVIKYKGTNRYTLKWIARGGANITHDDYALMLDELESILAAELENNPENGRKILNAIEAVLSCRAQLVYADAYKKTTDDNTRLASSALVSLAQEITEGCTYDYEKAYAIQQYFRSGEYYYDINYIPPDKSVEYFLFESKRGSCSDYATAYVLLARLSGLSVRYTEGYLADRSGTQGVFYVKESTSHAYPEVFIPGAGWVVYEPTSGIEVEEEGGSFWSRLLSGIKMDYALIRTIAIVAGVLIATILLLRLFMPLLLEAAFVIGILIGRKNATDIYLRLLKKTSGRRLRKKYRRLYGKKRLLGREGSRTLAPGEICKVFAEIGVDISLITDLVQDRAYCDIREAEKNRGVKSGELVKLYRKAQKVFTLS